MEYIKFKLKRNTDADGRNTVCQVKKIETDSDGDEHYDTNLIIHALSLEGFGEQSVRNTFEYDFNMSF